MGFMENFSKKRGRPRKIPADLLDSYQKLFSELTTDRSLNNVYHMTTATKALRKDEERYRYLIDRNSGRMRKTILAALGRLQDEDTICEAADYICEERMKTDEALDFIRIIRIQPKE
jgi:hypothetical protein